MNRDMEILGEVFSCNHLKLVIFTLIYLAHVAIVYFSRISVVSRHFLTPKSPGCTKPTAFYLSFI